MDSECCLISCAATPKPGACADSKNDPVLQRVADLAVTSTRWRDILPLLLKYQPGYGSNMLKLDPCWAGLCIKTYQMYSNVWLSDCWGPSSPRNISMVWQADKPDLPTVAEAKAMSGATEKCEDSADVAVGSVSIATRCRLCSRKESFCIFMNWSICGPRVSPKIISNQVLSDEDVRYRSSCSSCSPRKVAELKQALQTAGLPVTGKKAPSWWRTAGHRKCGNDPQSTCYALEVLHYIRFHMFLLGFV